MSKDNYTVRIKFWGTRGSIPTPGKYFIKYGGRNLFAFHHDPLRTDEQMDIMLYNAQKLVKPPLKLHGAREKTTVYL